MELSLALLVLLGGFGLSGTMALLFDTVRGALQLPALEPEHASDPVFGDRISG